MVSRVGHNMRARTRAAEYTAYSQPRVDDAPVAPAAVQAPAAQMTPEQKLQQLDKLAAGGYITPAEFKERRQAILDTM